MICARKASPLTSHHDRSENIHLLFFVSYEVLSFVVPISCTLCENPVHHGWCAEWIHSSNSFLQLTISLMWSMSHMRTLMVLMHFGVTTQLLVGSMTIFCSVIHILHTIFKFWYLHVHVCTYLGAGVDKSKQWVGWMTRIWFLTGEKGLFIYYCIQTGSGAHPASYSMGTNESLPKGTAAAGRWPLTSI
jgi:hypothetical protein